MMKIATVIMAGGVGSRFWPESRERRPKQLLEVVSRGRTLIQMTVDRVQEFSEYENTLIITNSIQRAELIRQVPEIPEENIIAEPFGRNTAPCVALAAKLVGDKLGPEAVMAILPADHIIKNPAEFTRLIQLGARLAYEHRSLVTVGVHPTRPETGFGYIQLDDENVPSKKQMPEFSEFELRDIFCVKRFAEKPDLATAVRFMESGDFLWNSGMFLWRVDIIEEALKKYTPDISEQIAKLPPLESDNFAQALNEAYGCFRGVSIDYGVMEHAKNVHVLRAGALGWSDVGSWDEVYRLSEKDLEYNVIEGRNVVAKSSKGSLVINRTDQLVALYGVENLIVVNTGDAILITTREHAQGIRDIVDYLKRNQLVEYL